MINAILPIRNDAWGSGEFQAPRGDKKHKGVDYSMPVNSIVKSPVSGWVTKLGYPYKDNFFYRYVEITDHKRLKHRFFYVEPSVALKEVVYKYKPIGIAQDIQKRYTTKKKRMDNHIHYEILHGRTPLDPGVFHA